MLFDLMLQLHKAKLDLLASIVPVLIFVFLSISLPACFGNIGGLCREGFWVQARRRNITQNCKRLSTFNAELGWHVSRFNSQWTQIDVAFGVKLQSDTGWLAWGINPLPQPQMIGTRAIIGIRQPNGSLSINTYNITRDTKKGCRLQPTYVDVEFRDMESAYAQDEEYFMMLAAVIIPDSTYDVSKLHHVWQVGYEVDGTEPRMHPKRIKNFDSTDTLNLWSGVEEDMEHKRHRTHLRKWHGILSIIGWGTFLPIGVIIARYIRFLFGAKYWYRLHVSFQVTGYLLGASGWGIGLILGTESPYYTFHFHRLLGIFIFIYTSVQILALRLRPDTHDEYRKYWNMYHHFSGYALLAVIILNIFNGINILKPDNAVWTWVYVGILLFLSVAVLVFECWSWIKFVRKNRRHNRSNGNKESRVPAQQGGDASALQPPLETTTLSMRSSIEE